MKVLGVPYRYLCCDKNTMLVAMLPIRTARVLARVVTGAALALLANQDCCRAIHLSRKRGL